MRGRISVILLVVATATSTVLMLGASGSSAAPGRAADVPSPLFWPTISGDTSTSGNLLTVDNGSWSDSPTSFTYQWKRCDAGTGDNCSDLPGQTGTTYTTVAADLGHDVGVEVTASNADGSGQAFADAGTIGAPTVVGFDGPEVNGDTSDTGNLLTIDPGTWTGSPTFAYQWYRCTDQFFGACSEIAGQTGTTYTTQAADLGDWVGPTVIATNTYGSTWFFTTTFSQIGSPAVVGSDYPSISGDTSGAGGLLTLDPGTWSGSPTFTYQWQQCDQNGFNCTDITGATASTYTIQAGDIGHVLTAWVTATNADGTSSSSASTLAIGVPSIANSNFPEISGDTSAVGSVLTVSQGEWNGSPTSFAYQWERCDANGGNCADIDEATSNTYTLVTADLGHIVDATVTASSAGGSTTVTAYTFAPVGAPTIVGFDYPSISGDTSGAGHALTVDNGTWSGSPTFAYQWSRCNATGSSCVTISGATSATYTTQSADLGHVLQAGITGTNGYGSDEEFADTQAIGLPQILNFDYPEIFGDETASGNVLTVDPGTWSGATTLTYQWSRCGSLGLSCTNISDATASTYTTQAGDLGQVLRATVTATNAAGSVSQFTFTDWGIGSPEITGSYPSITGDTSSVGSVLTAHAGGWNGSPTFTYQWDRCDTNGSFCSVIGGATGSSYTTVDADAGHDLQVGITATNANGSSSRTATTGFAVGRPAIVGAYPTITGNPTVVGSTIGVTNGTWVGATSMAYQWYRCSSTDEGCSAIAGQTAQNYTLVSADVGHVLEAAVTATNASGSSTAEAVVLVGAPFNISVPTITGDVSAVGKTLTASNGTWYGNPTFTRQWWRCDASGNNCNEITSATGTSYVLTGADVGHTLFVEVDAHNSISDTFADSVDTVSVGNGTGQSLLTVTTAGSGSGTVTSSPDGIDCGDTCSAEFTVGTTVVLTPAAAAGSTFAGWSGGGCSGTGGCSINLAADTTVTATFTANPAPPTITSFTPTSVGAHGTVTITGTNLKFTTAVTVGGAPVPFTVVSNTTITFTVPAGAGGGQIGLTTTSGFTNTGLAGLVVLPPPTITSIGPGSGPVGTLVTITGTNLSGVVGVELGHVVVVPTSVSDGQVTFVVPPGATSGPIKVISPAGSATSTDTFTVTG